MTPLRRPVKQRPFLGRPSKNREGTIVISTATDLLAEALFASDLQPSQPACVEAVRAAVTQTLHRRGSDGCTAAVATEFGDHPDTAVRRMTWVRQTLTTAYPTLTTRREVQLTA